MKKILLIDDEEKILNQLKKFLQFEGYTVFTASNGKQGIEAVQKHLPDLILCDIMMPEIDGRKVLEVIRQNPLTAAIPFIFITAKTEKQDFRLGMELGADDYLTKPFTTDELFRAINTRLSKQDQQKQIAQQKMEELQKNISQNLPHEVFTPLNSIIGFSSLLRQSFDMFDQQQVMQMLSSIYNAAESLHKTLQRFIFFANLQVINSNPQQLREFTNAYSHNIKQTIEGKALETASYFGREADLKISIQQANLRISGENLMKILEELISNAAKFSEQASEISVRGKKQDNMYKLCIKNKGKGMTAEQIAAINPYLQFNKNVHAQRGAGLGLAITKILVEMHQGQFEIESTPGKYTQIKILLP